MGRSGLVAVVAVLAALCSCTAAPAPAVDLAFGIETFVGASRTGRFDQVRAIVVEVEGQRRFVRGDPAARGDVRSVTKSVVSTLVGIAIGDGYLRGVGQELRDLLPSYVDDMPDRLRSATLRDVLTMTAGTAPDRATGATPPTRDEDWAGYAAALAPRPDPGVRFTYSTVGSHLLSAVLAEALDRPVLDYAREKLFAPLGIDTGPGFAWRTDPQGRPFGGSGLEISADDMLKIGRLYLDGGRWNRRQVVPAAWVDEATRTQVATRDSLPAYGYQWWITGAARHQAFVAAGYGGQLIEVVPDLRLIVVVASDVGAVPGASPEEYAELVDRVIAPAVR